MRAWPEAIADGAPNDVRKDSYLGVRAAQHVDTYPKRKPAVLAAYQEQFSVAAAGARYRVRLEELWGQQQELAGRLRWGKNAVSTNPLNSVD